GFGACFDLRPTRTKVPSCATAGAATIRPDCAREQRNSFHSFRASSRSPAEIEGRSRTSFADHGGNGRAATDLPWEVDQPRSKAARDLHPFKPLESKKLCPGAKVEPGPRWPGSAARKLAA